MAEANPDAIQRKIDDLWKQTNDPKIGMVAMRKLYRQMADLREQLRRLENEQAKTHH